VRGWPVKIVVQGPYAAGIYIYIERESVGSSAEEIVLQCSVVEGKETCKRG